MEEIVCKPTLEQLKIDIKKELTKYFVICIIVSLIFFLLNAAALILLLPFGFIVVYHKYTTIRKSLNYRWIKIRDDSVLQDAPGMNAEIKKIPYALYSGACLKGGQVCFKAEKQKITTNIKVSLVSIHLEGYPDKERIAREIDKKIKQYKNVDSV